MDASPLQRSPQRPAERPAGSEEVEEPTFSAPEPPPLLCRPVADAPPAGVFITWEGWRRYSQLDRVLQAERGAAQLEAVAATSSGAPTGEPHAEGNDLEVLLEETLFKPPRPPAKPAAMPKPAAKCKPAAQPKPAHEAAPGARKRGRPRKSAAPAESSAAGPAPAAGTLAAGLALRAGGASLADAAVSVALAQLGEPSLETLAEKLAAQGPAGEAGKGRKAGKAKLADLLNPSSPLHCPQLMEAYKAARDAIKA